MVPFILITMKTSSMQKENKTNLAAARGYWSKTKGAEPCLRQVGAVSKKVSHGNNAARVSNLFHQGARNRI